MTLTFADRHWYQAAVAVHRRDAAPAMSIRMRTAALLVTTALVLAGRPARAAITKSNVASLVQTWERVTTAGVTAGLVVAHGLVYVPSLDGNVYALDPITGTQRWAFFGNGHFGAVLAASNGNVCFANSQAKAYCVRGDTGTLVWERNLQIEQDAIWTPPAEANGMVFFSIASLSDNPCTKGRVVALDLETGDPRWTLQTVPDRICELDTAIECTDTSDCPGGACVAGKGGGVTATVSVDRTGEFLYMNTVGCYTFPSIGNSDSMFKIRAATGEPVWIRRVTPPEQFGFCANDSAIECGTAAHCTAVGGTCTKKANYHDFGFLNGPLLVDVPADGGGSETLIVSGSKNGTLYAFREDGSTAWTNEIQPIPVSPGFAGFGLFNAPLNYADGRLYAALYFLLPRRVCDNDHKRGCSRDGECPGSFCLPAPDHLMSFDPTDGSIVWSDEIGPSWSAVAVENGVLYAGTQVEDEETGASDFFAYDAASGTRLATFTLPSPTTGRAVVVGDTLIVGYGLTGASGVRAYSLCGNGQLDPGEACDPGLPGTQGCCTTSTCTNVPVDTPCTDDGNACTGGTCDGGGACRVTFAPADTPCTTDDGDVCTDAVCDAAGTCFQRDNTAPCDDLDACTSGDRCGAGTCAGTITTLEGVDCVLARTTDRPCGDESLPASLTKRINQRLAKARKLLDKAAKLVAGGKTTKVPRVRQAAMKQLDGISALTAKAARSKKATRRISAACQQQVDALVQRGRGVVDGFEF
jgi:outer membrane protein assembly factor BamB